jgi:hypothetical protein
MNTTPLASWPSPLRCREHDLALVIYDTPNCSSNIGRVVRVRGPVIRSHRSDNMLTWLIRPVCRNHWAIVNVHGGLVKRSVRWADRIEHPDAWLLPLRPDLIEGLTETSLADLDDDLSHPAMADLISRLVAKPVPELTSGLAVESSHSQDDLGHFIVGAIQVGQRHAEHQRKLGGSLQGRLVNT